MPVFDAYLMVDWSASNRPKQGTDSIWYCLASRESGTLLIQDPRNPRTRRQAISEIKDILVHLAAKRLVTLVGFDFPYSFPAGLSNCLHLDGSSPWKSIWNLLGECIIDAPDNRNNRFRVASSLNEIVTGYASPFWGCPGSAAGPYLSPKKEPGIATGLDEYRLTDTRVRGPQSPWKLYTVGSVGSQALLGIPHLRSLRYDPQLERISKVWPFETGFCSVKRPDPGDWQVLHAEIYPSLCSDKVSLRQWEVKDQVQVRSLARKFGALDEIEELSPFFDCPTALARQDREKVEREEGWILGVR